MKRRLLLPLVLLALCLLLVGVASATYTDAIGFRWNTSDPSPTLTKVWANGYSNSSVVVVTP